ncbi:MAG TPA: phosphotransferase [Actinomycetota bacterium]|nr:phosphotransferase [Actinomycetota bacterium]
MRTDETLIAVGETIRRFHDAAVGFAPPEEWAWRQWAHALGPGEQVCHGDLGHWNTVHRPDGGAAFIDWDSIRPDLPDLEFADAAWRFVPLADDDFLRDTGCPEPPDIARRLRLFCDAYSIRGNDRLLDLLHRSKERWPERFRWWPIGPSESAALLRQTAAELEWLDGVAPRLRAALR